MERRFKDELHADVSGQLIQNSYGEALQQTELVPLAEPFIDRPDLEKGQPFHYSATIEVRPFIEDLNVNGLKLKIMKAAFVILKLLTGWPKILG